MEPTTSDWSKISTDDLITIHQAFEQAVENANGSVSIHLNAVHWLRCQGVWADIELEDDDRDRRQRRGE